MFSRAHLPLFLIACAAGLAILGARWSLIERVGSPVPFQDQWYAEGEDLYLWALQDGVPAGHFFQPHNDHRIVPTRLLAFGLFEANAQWDVRVQAMVNALLAAAVGLPLLLLARPWLPPAGLALAGALFAWFYSQPGLYENALWGFQSQFFFLILFSLAELVLLLGRPAFSGGWWLGFTAGVAAVGAMGSGLLASVAVAAVAGISLVRDPTTRRTFAPTLIGAGLLAMLGLLCLPSRPAGSAAFQLGPFLHTWFHALGFPQREASWPALLAWLPFALLLGRLAFLRRAATSAERVLLAAGLWVLLQDAAIGYARPESGPILANRYGDILAIGLGVNFAALAWLGDHWRTGGRSRLRLGLLGVTAAAWLTFVGWQTALNTRIFRREIEPQLVAWRDEQISRIREFYRTGDRTVIERAAYPHIPVIDAPSLVRDLGFPTLRGAMPFELRDPVPLQFPAAAGQPSLANATPVTLPNEPGALHRGTYFPDNGAGGRIEVVSAPAAKHPRRGLLFKVAGDLRAGETELRIHDGQGRVAAVISGFKSDTLKPVIVTVPGATFSVEIIDRSPDRWLAFLEPVEIGPLSQAALIALPYAPRLAQAGWLALAGLFTWLALRRRSPQPA